jgi:hypothetical protein
MGRAQRTSVTGSLVRRFISRQLGSLLSVRRHVANVARLRRTPVCFRFRRLHRIFRGDIRCKVRATTHSESRPVSGPRYGPGRCLLDLPTKGKA